MTQVVLKRQTKERVSERREGRRRGKTDRGSEVSDDTGVAAATKSGTKIGRSFTVELELPSNVAVWQMRTWL